MEKNSKGRSFVRFQLPAIFWALLIFASSSMPGEKLPDLPILRLDKLIHFGVYFMLALLTFRALRHQTRFAFLSRHSLSFTVLIIILYGATDEVHQYFVPGRSADVFDLLADTVGACLLVAAVWWKGRTGLPGESG
jgi:VanZ family protein